MKEFLSQKGVAFTEKDVEADWDAMRELLDLEVMSTPCTVVDGQKLVGFDRKKLEALLG